MNDESGSFGGRVLKKRKTKKMYYTLKELIGQTCYHNLDQSKEWTDKNTVECTIIDLYIYVDDDWPRQLSITVSLRPVYPENYDDDVSETLISGVPPSSIIFS